MLRQFRAFGQTTVVKYGLIVLAVSFVTWGIGDYLNGGSNPAGAEVNGESISLNEIYTAYERRKSQLGQLTGNTISDETANQMGLPSLVVGELVRDKLLHQTSAEASLVASERVIAESISSMQTFQQNGEFSKDIYLGQLRTLGLTPATFEGNIKREQEQNMLSSLFTTPENKSWAKDIAAVNNSKFNLTLVPISAANLPALPAATNKELEEFYTARSAQYATPEMRNIDVVTLSTAELLKNIVISAAEIETYYTDNPAEFLTAAERKVMQIISPTQEEAIKKRAELVAGAAPSKAIDLGWATANDLPANISTPVFNLPINEYSQPIETPFGYALVWSTEAKEVAAKPLGSVKKEIETILAYEKAENNFEDILNDVQDAAAAGDTMASIAAQFNLPLKNYAQFNQATDIDNQLKQTAFELNEGEISDAVELASNDGVAMAFVNVNSITESTLPPLNTQKRKVTADFNQTRSQAHITSALAALQKRLQAGEDVANAARAEKIKLRPITLNNQTRASLEKLNWRPQYIDGLLSLSQRQVLAQTVPYKGNQALVILNKRILAEPTALEIETATKNLQDNLNTELFQQYLSSLQASADINLYEQRLNAAFNQNQ